MQTQTSQAAQYAEVLELLEHYAQGLYTLDTERLAQAFSPSATYATIQRGDLLTLAIDDYFERLAQRTAPSSDGTPFGYTVNSIRFAGEHTALAELQCSMFGHDYTDFLSLLRIDGRWRIQAKVFEGVPHLPQEVA
ncbi:MAG: nuclear transport factor 2 family protein [Planctomycetota bacterium]|jgi:hypothetical protein